MRKLFSLVFILGLALVLSACGTRRSSLVNLVSMEDFEAQTDIQITFRVSFGQTITPHVQNLIDDFNEKYDNVTCTMEVVGGYDNLLKQTKLDVQGNTAPTMVIGYPDHIAAYLLSDGVVPLDDFMASEEVGFTEDDMNDFIPSYLEENNKFDARGTYFSLPFNKSTEVLVYNKAFFDYFDLDVPTTWQEVDTVAKEIVGIVKSGDADNTWSPGLTMSTMNDFIPINYDSNSNYFITTAHQWNGPYTSSALKADDSVDLEKGKMDFADSTLNANTVAGLTFMKTMADYTYGGNPAPLVTTPEYWEELYGSNPFKQGKCVMTIGSTAGVSNNQGGVATNLGYAPIPYDEVNAIKTVIQQGTNVAILSQADDYQRMAAWLFIKHCLSLEGTISFAVGTGYFPVRNSAYSYDAEIAEGVSEINDQAKVYYDFLNTPTIEQIAKSKVAQVIKTYKDLGYTYYVDPAWSGSADVRLEVGIAMVQILIDKIAIETALTDAKNRVPTLDF